jgi:hypothetical protein
MIYGKRTLDDYLVPGKSREIAAAHVDSVIAGSAEWVGRDLTGRRLRSEFDWTFKDTTADGVEMIRRAVNASPLYSVVRGNPARVKAADDRTGESAVNELKFTSRVVGRNNHTPLISGVHDENAYFRECHHLVGRTWLPSPSAQADENEPVLAGEVVNLDAYSFDRKQWWELVNSGKVVIYHGAEQGKLTTIEMAALEKYRNKPSEKVREMRYADVVELFWERVEPRNHAWLSGLSSIMCSNIILWIAFSSHREAANDLIHRHFANTPERSFTEKAKWVSAQNVRDARFSRPLRPSELTNLGDLAGRYILPLDTGWGFDQLTASKDLLSNDVALKSRDPLGNYTEEQLLASLRKWLHKVGDDFRAKKGSAVKMHGRLRTWKDYLRRPELFATAGSSRGLKVDVGQKRLLRATKAVTVYTEDFEAYMDEAMKTDELIVGSSVKPDRPKPRIIVPFPLDQTVADTYLARLFDLVIDSSDTRLMSESVRSSATRRAKMFAATNTDVKILAYDWTTFERHHSLRTWDLMLEVLTEVVLGMVDDPRIREDIATISTWVRRRYMNAKMRFKSGPVWHEITNQGTNLSGSRFTSLFNLIMNDFLHDERDRCLAESGTHFPKRTRYSQGDDAVEFCLTQTEAWLKIRVFTMMGCKTNFGKLVCDVGRTTFLKEEFSGTITGGLPRVVSSLTEHSPEGGEAAFSSHMKLRELAVKLHNVHRRKWTDPGDWGDEVKIMECAIRRLGGLRGAMDVPQEFGGYGLRIHLWDKVTHVVKIKDMEPASEPPEWVRGIRWKESATLDDWRIKHNVNDLEFASYKRKIQEARLPGIQNDSILKWFSAKMKSEKYRLVTRPIKPYLSLDLDDIIAQDPREYDKVKFQTALSPDELQFVINTRSGGSVKDAIVDAYNKVSPGDSGLFLDLCRRWGVGSAVDMLISGVSLGTRCSDYRWVASMAKLLYERSTSRKVTYIRFKCTLALSWIALSRVIPGVGLWR